MHHFDADKYSTGFYDKLEKLVRTGEGRINVVQIGGSHIQAGTFSGQVRSRLQTLNGEMNAGWGFMFPYRISRSNSPYGYYIRYNGRWQSTRNIERRKTSNLGVGGISAATSAPKAELTILLEDKNKLDYSFNKLRIFYENSGAEYSVSVDSSVLKNLDAVAIVVAEENGGLQISAQLVADSAEVAMSVRNIVEGLVALKALSEAESPLGDILRNVRFVNDGPVLHMNVPIATDQIEAIRDL